SDIAGSLYLEGATVSTTGPLTISGTVGLDALYSQDGAATLSIGGALTVTNTGTLEMGGGRTDRGHSVTATSFVNSGKVDLNGDLTNALNVSGTTTNNASISIASETEELAGAVDGTGSFNLSSANLHFDSSVSAGQNITESGADGLILDKAQSFAA